MNKEITKLLEGLRGAGWSIQQLPEACPIHPDIQARYPWFPPSYRELVEEIKSVTNADETAWLLAGPDYAMEAESAFAWNEWERQSLDAAGEDETWRREIEEFWDAHLPVLLSVKSGYAYFAIEKTSLTVVCGQEPEYEETTKVAESIEDLLRLLANQDERVKQWI